MGENAEFTHRFKICIFGDGGVGKTTLTKRYLTGVFEIDYQLTLGMDFYVKKLIVDGVQISLQIWDFAGEKRFRFLMPSALIGCEGALFLFDISRYKTFENLNDWISIFKENLKKKNIPVLIIGSKLDLDFIRAISIEEGKNLTQSNGFNNYMECSSKTGENVQKVFYTLTQIILKSKLQELTTK